jgi:class 3 adenylate cyclase/CheY-like chemotaxis protein
MTVPNGHLSGDEKIQILIVDDEPINQQVLRNHLADRLYQITSVMDGASAVRLIEEGKVFDLVLLDIMMPNMTGYKVCQQIRKKYLASQLPIIMITAKNQVSDLVEALAYGANDYLAKPFSKEEFLARIKTHLDLYSINSATNRFVPSEFLRSLGYETITDVRLGDYQEKDVTVFFSDIRSYTTMAETMTPEQNFKFVGTYVNRMGPIIRRFDGFVLHYLGDGIMALFLKSPDKAVQAAITMQKRIRRYNDMRVRRGRNPIEVGMGLHSGPLVMGIIGDKHRNDPATISDAVNIASRMEGLTNLFGARILVTKSTMDRLLDPGAFSHRYLGKVLTKGKKEQVEVYELLDGESDPRKIAKLYTKKHFEAGIRAFIHRDYKEALNRFGTVLDHDKDDKAAKYYLEQVNAALKVLI